MHRTSPSPTSTRSPPIVHTSVPRRPYSVSSYPSWLCDGGAGDPAGTSNSNSATEPFEVAPSTRNLIAIPPILISSPVAVDMGATPSVAGKVALPYMAASSPSSRFTTSPGASPPGPPLIGALLRLASETVRRRMLESLHAHGFDDLDPH